MAHIISHHARLAGRQPLGPILRLGGIAALLLVLSAPVAVLACDTGSDASTPAAKTKKR
jgi:hypothetical protein